MTIFMTYMLILFMVGVVIKRFVNAQVGDALEIIGAVLFVLAFLLTVIH